MKNSVVIPVYKSKLDHLEKISLIQAARTFLKNDVILVTHKDVDVSEYQVIFGENNNTLLVEYFDSKFFKNITGYNFLMLSKGFYKRFEKYNYILIYQPDCFVFRDELDQWCEKGFDYIGSPWFSHYIDYSKDTPFWYNGNGGFSLRKVDKFIQVLDWKYPLLKPHEVWYWLNQEKMPSLKRVLLWASRSLGLNNGVKSLLKKEGYDFKNIDVLIDQNDIRSNEDVIWSSKFRYTWINMRIPDLDEGLGFSFERSPEYLKNRNNNELPFGCHAWAKYNLDFWTPYIEAFDFKIKE